jgi:hypothetical protein
MKAFVENYPQFKVVLKRKTFYLFIYFIFIFI